MDIQTSHDTQALARVEAKLRELQEQLARLSEQGEEPAYRLGWASGGIKAALAEIDAWKDDAPCGLCRLRAERGIEQPPGGCTCLSGDDAVTMVSHTPAYRSLTV
jgi:hypothetical protein